MMQTQIHASCVAFGDRAILIRGPSGSGKSELVLRLIDGEGYGLGARLQRAALVADDQVVLSLREGMIFASPALKLAGLLEIRGQGIVSVEFVENVALVLVVDLMPYEDISRMPEPDTLTTALLGLQLPCLALDGHSAAGPARLRSKCFSSGVKKR